MKRESPAVPEILDDKKFEDKDYKVRLDFAPCSLYFLGASIFNLWTIITCNLYSPLWKRVIAWERSGAASGYGIIWGDAHRNKQEGI